MGWIEKKAGIFNFGTVLASHLEEEVQAKNSPLLLFSLALFTKKPPLPTI